jgi:hypothetical protein
MTPERIFTAVTLVATCGWALLVFFPRKPRLVTVAARFVPAMLAVAYCGIVASQWMTSDGGFGSLSAVARLFANRWLLLAGWIHYLAFDLFVGAWILQDSQRRSLPHAVLVPCLLLTFMFGPAGLLLYLAAGATRAAGK